MQALKTEPVLSQETLLMYELPRQPFMLTNDLNERHEHSVCIRELQNGTVPCKQHEPFGFDQYYVTNVQIQIGMYVNHVTIYYIKLHKYYRSDGGASVVCFEPFVSIQLPSFKRDDAMDFRYCHVQIKVPVFRLLGRISYYRKPQVSFIKCLASTLPDPKVIWSSWVSFTLDPCIV